MTEEHASLKPCPFCGDDDLLPIYDDSAKVWAIQCLECSASIDGMTADDVIKAWNRRDETEIDNLREELAERGRELSNE